MLRRGWLVTAAGWAYIERRISHPIKWYSNEFRTRLSSALTLRLVSSEYVMVMKPCVVDPNLCWGIGGFKNPFANNTRLLAASLVVLNTTTGLPQVGASYMRFDG